MFILKERVEKVTPEILELYKDIGVSTIGHMTDFGFITDLQPIFRPIQFAGNAVTVRIPHLDSSAVHKALDIVHPGDVLVIETAGDDKRSCFGEIVAYAAKTKQVAGVVLSGCVTDYRALQDLKLPIYSSGVTPLTTRIMGLEGQINLPVSICGVTVHPGDFVVADDDGVLVLDPAEAESYGKRAIAKQNTEPEKKRRIHAGESLAAMSGAADYFTSK